MDALERCFKGLADRNRLRILNLLLHGELCGCDIQYVLDTSQPNVSRHLAYLRNCGLVADRRVGYRVFYSLAHPEEATRKGLLHFLRLAFRKDEVLREDLRKLRDAAQSGACVLSERRSPPGVVRLKAGPAARA